jgi:predicted DNA-binding protein
MVERTRERAVTIRVTDEEAEMLWALAKSQGLTASDILRQYIRKAHAKAFPKKK